MPPTPSNPIDPQQPNPYNPQPQYQPPNPPVYNPPIQTNDKKKQKLLILVAIVAIVLIAALAYLLTPMSCSISSYSAELDNFGDPIFDVHVKNSGITPQTITVRCTIDTNLGTYYRDTIVDLGAGEIKQLSVSYWLPIDASGSADSARCYIV